MEGETMGTQPEGSSKGGLWGIIIIVIVLLLGGLWWGMRGDTNTVPNDNGTTDESADSSEGVFSGGLADLMGRGGSWKCSWNVDAEGAAGSGMIYVSGKKFASSVTSETPGGAMTAQAVSDGEYMYSWSDAAPMGIKMKLDAVEGQTADAPSGDVVSAENPFAGEYNYDCDPWNADDSMFVPPSSVTFTEFDLGSIPDFGSFAQ